MGFAHSPTVRSSQTETTANRRARVRECLNLLFCLQTKIIKDGDFSKSRRIFWPIIRRLVMLIYYGVQPVYGAPPVAPRPPVRLLRSHVMVAGSVLHHPTMPQHAPHTPRRLKPAYHTSLVSTWDALGLQLTHTEFVIIDANIRKVRYFAVLVRSTPGRRGDAG